jgi:hypothetical protein
MSGRNTLSKLSTDPLIFSSGGFIVGTYKSRAMTYKARLKVSYDTEWTHTGGVYDDEILPEEHYTFEIPTEDINSMQLFRFFGTIARTMGHNEFGIMKGACHLAFNDMRSFEDMKKVADEYDLYLAEEYSNKVIPLENKNYELEKQVRDLKAKLSRCENPDSPDYTEEEMNAMSNEEQ